MSQNRNFPEDFFGDADDDPIKDNDPFADASTSSATQTSDSSPPNGSSAPSSQGDSVFAAAPSQTEQGDTPSVPDSPRKRERAVMVTKHPDHTSGVEELNNALSEGWSIDQVALMSGSMQSASMHFSALVVLSQDE